MIIACHFRTNATAASFAQTLQTDDARANRAVPAQRAPPASWRPFKCLNETVVANTTGRPLQHRERMCDWILRPRSFWPNQYHTVSYDG